MARLSYPTLWLCILYINMDNPHDSRSFTPQLDSSKNHACNSLKARIKAGGCCNTEFWKTSKSYWSKTTAQDASVGSQASSSPIAQKSSHLISCLLCIRKAVGSAQCCILICALLWSIQQQFSPEWKSSLSSRDELSSGERCFSCC